MKYRNSFFRVLTNIERQIARDTMFPADIKQIFDNLVSFVKNGEFTSSETSKFICANYNITKIDDLLNKWNQIYKPKDKRTLQNQVSRVSDMLYDFFELSEDVNLETVFLSLDEINHYPIYSNLIVEIQDLLTTYGNAKNSRELLSKDVFEYVGSTKASDLEFDDYVDEIEKLKSFVKKDVSVLDKVKVATIIKKLDGSLMVENRVKGSKAGQKALDKARILSVLSAETESVSSYYNKTVQNSPLDVDLSIIDLKDEQICLSDEFMKIISNGLSNETTINEDNVEELKKILHLFFTQDGFNEYIGKFSKAEWKQAKSEFMAGTNLYTKKVQ